MPFVVYAERKEIREMAEKREVDGVVISLLTASGSTVLKGKFELSSETRKRYGTDATSITLEAEGGMRKAKIELETADLIEALVEGGMTADDLRLYADIADGKGFDGVRIIEG